MKPQTKQVLEVLKREGSITDRKARNALNITRVAARICELKHKHGVGIETKRETHRGGWHARYVLAS